MAGPGGREVGRVSVRVLPNTTTFLPSLKKYLTRIQRELEINIRVKPATAGLKEDVEAAAANAGRNVEVEVPLNADTQKFVAEVKARIAALQNDIELNVPLDADGGALRAKLEAMIRELESSVDGIDVSVELGSLAKLRAEIIAAMARIRAEMRPVKVPIDVDNKLFGMQVRDSIDKALERIRINIPAGIDKRRLETKARTLVKQIERRLGALEIGLGLEHESRIRAEIRLLIEELQFMARLDPVQIPVHLDESGKDIVEREVKDFAEKVNKPLLGIFDLGRRGVRPRTAAIGSLIYLLVSAAPAILSIAGDLTKVVGLLGLIPALVLGAAGALGTLGVGFKGFFKALGKMGTDQFDEALKNLAPSAADTAREIKKLGPAFHKLRLDVQERLFHGLAKTVSRFSSYVPVLRSGLGQVADAWNDTFDWVGKAITGKDVLDDIRTVLKNTGGAVRRFGHALSIFLPTFTSIAAVGSDFLPGLAGKLDDAAKRFDKFIDSARETGKLKQWIQDALDVVGELWSILKDTAAAMKAIFDVASQHGGGGLQGLANVMKSIRDTVESPEFQKALGIIFDGLSRAFGSLGDAVKPLGEALGAIAPTLGNLAEFSGQVIKLAIQVGGAVIKFIAPALNAISSIFPHVEDGANRVKGYLAGMFKLKGTDEFTSQVKESFRRIGEDILPDLERLGGSIKKIFDTIVPIIRDVVQGFIDNWPAISAKGEDAWRSLGGVISAVADDIDQVMEKIQIAWKIFGPAIVAYIVDTFKNVISFIAGVLKVVEGLLMITAGFFQAGPEGMQKVSDGIKKVFSGLWQALVAVFAQIWTQFISIIVAGTGKSKEEIYRWLTDVWNKIRAFFALMLAAAKLLGIGLPRAIFNMITTTGNTIRTGFQAIKSYWSGVFGDLYAKAVEKLSQIGQAFVRVLGQIKQAVSSGLSQAKAIFAGKFAEIVSVVTSGMSRVWSVISSYVARAVSAFRSNIGSLPGIAIGIMASLVSAFANGIAHAVSQFASVGSQIIGVLSQINLYSVGAQVVSGFVSGISAGIGRAVGAAANLAAQALAAAKNRLGVHSPSREFDAVGRASAEGLAQGIRGGAASAATASRQMMLGAATAARVSAAIASPSKVWAEIGSQLGAGLSVGLAKSHSDVTSSVVALSDAMVKSLTLTAPDMVQVGISAGQSIADGVSSASVHAAGAYVPPPAPTADAAERPVSMRLVDADGVLIGYIQGLIDNGLDSFVDDVEGTR